MVAKRKSVDAGTPTKSGANKSLVARLRKAGSTCAPEKIWSVLEAALGGRSLNLQAALEAARGEASASSKRVRAATGRQQDERSSAKPKAASKQKTPAASKKIPIKREQPELVDLNEFETLVDLVDAWMRMKGKVKRETSREPSTQREIAAKKEPRAKREPTLKPTIKRELVNEIMKLGIIDLTEGELQPRSAGRRPSSSGASPSGKVRSPQTTKQASQAGAAKGNSVSVSRAGGAVRRSLSKAKLLGQRRSVGKVGSPKKKAVDNSPRGKMPQGLKSLNKLARKCDPQKLWTILQAAAHENKPSASIGAALRAAKGRQA
uniref:Uncharacterized protein n=1 Tax=Alexandrium monilatum TaxID=311494 RepID=A0A7S4SB17_9DINO|mmetsp:Transcript_88281/g.263276  ORF Transcript_88281/g.263276 Transcript_88281/m.263276 type:complete len:320 (+) Transcript_88281:53-1012(+)